MTPHAFGLPDEHNHHARRHPQQKRSRGYRLLWWLGVVLAEAVPLSLIGTVGYTETWEAFDKYTAGVEGLPTTHPIRVPRPEEPYRNYTRTDADLIAWHAGLSTLYDSIRRMAVVGVVKDADTGLELELEAPEGKKGRFYPQRDLPLLLYLALSAAAYLSSSVHLALAVLNLNIYSIAICIRLKGLTSAMGRTVEGLRDVQRAFLLLPQEDGVPGMLRQQLCLQKLDALQEEWAGRVLGMSFNLPLVPRTITISTSIMASLAAATTVRAVHCAAYGFFPGLPRIRWRERLGAAVATGATFRIRPASPKRE